MNRLCLIAAIALAAVSSSALAQSSTRSFYDRNGSFAGQSFTYGNQTSFSDSRGRFFRQRDPARQLDFVLRRARSLYRLRHPYLAKAVTIGEDRLER
jgi:hypothetical protein